MELMHYLDEHPLTVVVVFISLLTGFILGLIFSHKFLWAKIGTFSSFFKEGKNYILKKTIGDQHKEMIYVFQKVKIINNSAIYSRNFYLEKEPNLGIAGEEMKQDSIFKVEEIKKRNNGRISTLTIVPVKIKISLPQENLLIT